MDNYHKNNEKINLSENICGKIRFADNVLQQPEDFIRL